MNKQIERGLAALCAALMLLPLLVAAPAAALDNQADGKVSIHCDFPGQVIEAGETATFTLSVTNNGNADQMNLWTESFVGSRDWEMRFVDGEAEVNKVSIPAGGSKTVTLRVETAADTQVGEYPVKAHVGDGSVWLHVSISKTHTGELGTLELTVTDKDGEKVKGASVLIYEDKHAEPSDKVMTTADGKISTGLPQGVYDLVIEKAGYKGADKKDVKVKCGITTDAGTVMLEKSPYAAEVTIKSPTITTPVGKNAVFELILKNAGTGDDTYVLSTKDLPEGWYARYKESAGASGDLSEIFLRAGEEKTLYLEAIPPYGTGTDDYTFQTLIDSAAGQYSDELTAKIRGSYEMRVSADRYRYETDMGGTVSFDLKVRNAGTAGALTGIGFKVMAPEGWSATVTPTNITSLQPGERDTVKVTVAPPSSIVASDYKVSVKVISDQGEQEEEFRIVVKEQSFAAVLGVLLLVAIAGGVWYYFRKYQRR
ncbi:alpha-1,6-galactosidase [Methanofollis formosanus]|uniref:Alpha-1,6-galactosidase n=1 Tax=Methanofollis formosanus TaxID=299308 RepID=A0A8G1EGY3_9EURY|nr:NEW3 domain-containing protein [Methanofollis formosanus]QYZ79397.1 alpha-1,6-galactosidase [Methanofollis formosanus]